jgi:hypothetical protein
MSSNQDYFRRWTTGSGRIELRLWLSDSEKGHHQGECLNDVQELLTVPYIYKQLDALDSELIAAELKEYGAWDADELGDHSANLERLVWIACGDLQDEYFEFVGVA